MITLYSRYVNGSVPRLRVGLLFPEKTMLPQLQNWRVAPSVAVGQFISAYNGLEEFFLKRQIRSLQPRIRHGRSDPMDV